MRNVNRLGRGPGDAGRVPRAFSGFGFQFLESRQVELQHVQARVQPVQPVNRVIAPGNQPQDRRSQHYDDESSHSLDMVPSTPEPYTKQAFGRELKKRAPPIVSNNGTQPALSYSRETVISIQDSGFRIQEDATSTKFQSP